MESISSCLTRCRTSCAKLAFPSVIGGKPRCSSIKLQINLDLDSLNPSSWSNLSRSEMGTLTWIAREWTLVLRFIKNTPHNSNWFHHLYMNIYPHIFHNTIHIHTLEHHFPIHNHISSDQPLLGPAVVTRWHIIEGQRAEIGPNLGVNCSMRAEKQVAASWALYAHITPQTAFTYNHWPYNVECDSNSVVGVRLLRILPLDSP